MALIGVSLAVTAVSVVSMARRAAAFNEQLPTPFVFQKPWNLSRDIQFAGRAISLRDALLEDGSSAIKVTYGEQTKTFPVKEPKVRDHPDLGPYEERLAVLAFVPTKEGEKVTIDPADERVRAVMVVRRTSDEFAGTPWADVRVKDWVFDVYEFARDGALVGPRRMQFRDRRGRIPAEQYAAEDLRARGQAVPEGKLTEVEGIEERSWEWQACLFVVPKMQVSRYRYRNDAVDGTDQAAGFGWTFAGAGLGMIGVMGGVAVMMASRVGARPSVTGRQP
jgi:hypothetical protein